MDNTRITRRGSTSVRRKVREHIGALAWRSPTFARMLGVTLLCSAWQRPITLLRMGHAVQSSQRSLVRLAELGVVDEVLTVAGQMVPTQRFIEADVGMKFPKLDIGERLYAANGPWPAEYPFPPEAFRRQDESDDADFYAMPRLCYHIDEGAVRALTNYYKENIAPGSSVLDICSSWVSHYPANFPQTMERISGTGMRIRHAGRALFSSACLGRALPPTRALLFLLSACCLPQA